MKTSGRKSQVFSVVALIASALIWWFIDGQVYTACAFGSEYTLLFGVPDGSAPTAFVIAIASSLFGLGFAIRAACLKPARKLYVALLITANLSISPLGWLEVLHTGSTTQRVM